MDFCKKSITILLLLTFLAYQTEPKNDEVGTTLSSLMKDIGNVTVCKTVKNVVPKPHKALNSLGHERPRLWTA